MSGVGVGSRSNPRPEARGAAEEVTVRRAPAMRGPARALALALLVVGGLVLPLAAIESISAALLALDAVRVEPRRRDLLLAGFPAQLYLDDAALADAFQGFVVPDWVTVTLHLLSRVEPATGLPIPQCAEWYDGDEVHRVRWPEGGEPEFYLSMLRGLRVHEYDGVAGLLAALRQRLPGRPWVVTFGGSTSVFRFNWPGWLQQAARAQGHDARFLVLNLAQPGATSKTMNEFFTEWAPRLDEALGGRRPDLVVSLDGFNDVYRGVASWIEYSRSGAAGWNYSLNDHELLESYAELQRGPRAALRTAAASLLPPALDSAVRRFAVRAMPHMLAVLLGARQEPFALRQEPGIAEPILDVPQTVRERVFAAFESHLTALAGNVSARGSAFHAFLQPIALSSYYPFNPKRQTEYRDAHHAMRVFAIAGPAGGRFRLGPADLYEDAERLYAELDAGETPGRFTNLSRIFATADEDLYSGDSIHYSPEGSRRIAAAIVERLARSGELP